MSNGEQRIYGGIEAGGTKVVCGIATEKGVVLDRVSFPTTAPEETLAQVVAYFEGKEVAAIGIGSFGPLDVNPTSPTYGRVTTTPKPGWKDFDFLGTVRRHFLVPVAFDTDVNAAALGETRWGAARDVDGCLYITVGTGIGAGLVRNGSIANGFSHPEMGHILVRRHPDDTFSGSCPYHHDCLEGLASGPAIAQRWGKPGSELPADHAAWTLEADYLAQAMMTFVLVTMPGKIVLGGGVSHQVGLFPMIRDRLHEYLHGYVTALSSRESLDTYVVPPGLGDNAGLLGAIALAMQARAHARA